MSQEVPQCNGTVYHRDGGWWNKFKRCTRAGKIEREGAHYCGIHDPVAVQDKGAARTAAYEAKYVAERNAREFASAAVKACEGVPIEQLRPGLLHELLRPVGTSATGLGHPK